MNIQEVRQKFPQYNDLSDQQLADALHAKYYPDMDKSEYYQKIGFSIQKTTPKKEPLITKRDISKFARPVLELGGAGLGGVLAVPANAVAPGAAEAVGVGLGYLGGKKAADALDSFLGTDVVFGKEKPTPTEAVREFMTKDIPEAGIVALSGPVLQRATVPIGRALRSGAEGLYAGTLKVPPSVPNEIRSKAIKTGLEGRYPITEKGLARLNRDINAMNSQIGDVIEAAGKSGDTVKTRAILSRVDQLKKFYANTPNPKPYFDELDAIKQDMLSYHGDKIPVAKAQKIKQAIYALNRKHYGEMKTLQIETNKAIARGIKEELVAKYPQLGTLNKKDSDLIKFEEFLERAVNRTGNYDIANFGDAAWTTAGAVMGGYHGAAAAGAASRIARFPGFKSRLSFLLDKASKISGKGKYAGRLAGYGIAKSGDNPEPGE